MRILVTNDDGYQAPGLEILEKIARELSDDVWVVAPESEQSGAGHSLTLHAPIPIVPLMERRYAIAGTPTDCVMIAVRNILRDKRPDLVLSGINAGANLGDDITYSGTVSAAMEGTLLGIRSIALSQTYTDKPKMKWDVSEAYAKEVIERLLEHDWPKDMLMSINFPDVKVKKVKGMQYTKQGSRRIGDVSKAKDPEGKPYFMIGSKRRQEKYEKGTDLCAVRDGYISVTPISMDLTHHQALEEFGTLDIEELSVSN